MQAIVKPQLLGQGSASLPSSLARLVDDYNTDDTNRCMEAGEWPGEMEYDDWGNISIELGATIAGFTREFFQSLLGVAEKETSQTRAFIDIHVSPEIKEAFRRIQFDPARKKFSVPGKHKEQSNSWDR